MIAVIAALGASLSWTTAALVAHGPARSLGAFDFTRTQLVSAAMILVVGAGATGAWTSVDWGFWPSYVTASLAGVVVGNLAMTVAPHSCTASRRPVGWRRCRRRACCH